MQFETNKCKTALGLEASAKKMLMALLALAMAVSLSPAVPSEKALAAETSSTASAPEASLTGDAPAISPVTSPAATTTASPAASSTPTPAAATASASPAPSPTAPATPASTVPATSATSERVAKAYASLPSEWKTCGSCEWQVDDTGCLVIRPANGAAEGSLGELVTGTWPNVSYSENSWHNAGGALLQSVASARIEGKVQAPVNATGLFYGLPNMTALNLEGLDTSQTTNFDYLFYNDVSLKTIEGLARLNTSNVTSLKGVFSSCGITTVDLSGWDTSSVTSMEYMFQQASSLTSVDLSAIDASSVTSMMYMFLDCHLLESVVFPEAKTSSLQNIAGLFYNGLSLKNVSFGGFDTSKVTAFTIMFVQCLQLETLDISCFDTSSATTMNGMIQNNDPNALTTIKVGPKFTLENIDETNLGPTYFGPFPVDKHWVSSADGNTYAGNEIPSNVAATYTAKALPTSSFETLLEFCDARTPVTWNDDWFDISSTEYNHNLATTAAVLASAAYDEEQILDAFSAEKLGFDDREIETYYPREKDYTSDYGEVAYAFGTRITADDTPVVAVIVRGTPGNGEWLSNLDIGTGKTHQGFESAASQVLAALKSYLHDNNINMSKARVIVAGHSRGAAVSNLIAAKIDDGALKSDRADQASRADQAGPANQTSQADQTDQASQARQASQSGELDSSRVYAFTFATPASTKDTGYQDEKYDNIFNIVNPEDLITMVPLSQWGFHRYGRDMVLPSKSNTSPAQYNTMYHNMNGYFRSYYGGTDYQNYTTGVLGPYSICANLFRLAPTTSAYYRSLPQPRGVFGSLVKVAIMHKGGMSDALRLASAVINPWWASVITGICAGGVASGSFVLKPGVVHGHTQETYVAWMKSVDVQQIGAEPTIFRGAYTKLTVACPVDVQVYDSNGALVASIVADEVDDSLLADGLAAAIDEDGNKMIDIPADAGYTIKVTAYAEGEMDLTAESIASDPNERTSIKSYQGIELAPGGTFTLESPASINADAESLALIDDQTEAEAQAASTVTTAGATNCTVTVSSTGDGIAWGGGAVLAGGKARVHAQADAGCDFLGWYANGQLVSSEPDYEFRVSSDTQVEARFETAPATVCRLAGNTRYETSAMLSEQAYPKDGSCQTVIIARGDNFADALSAAGLAGVTSGQVLLTPTEGLTREVASEISRLGATKAYIVGGTQAVSAEAMEQASSLVGGNVKRVAGDTRYDTALAVYSAMQAASANGGFAIGDIAIVAQGAKAADALSASAISYTLGAPIFLVDPAEGASPETLAALRAGGFNTVLVMGGEAAVPRSVDAALADSANVVRIAGSDRFETSKEAALWACGNGMALANPVVASGNDANFPDALSASALAGRAMSPLLLVADSDLGYACIDNLLAEHANEIDGVYVAGGSAAVPEAVYEAVKRALRI